jgi:transposase
MEYSTAVIEKAQRLEQLLHRVAAGEALATANKTLDFDLDQAQLSQAQAKYEAGGCGWEALLDGRYGHAQKVHSGIREWLYTRKDKDAGVRAPQLAQEIKVQFGVAVAPGHINYLLRKRGLTAPPGRPYQQAPEDEAVTDGQTGPRESIDNAGIFFPGRREGGNGSGGRD